jgi:hypothetical protein
MMGLLSVDDIGIFPICLAKGTSSYSHILIFSALEIRQEAK